MKLLSRKHFIKSLLFFVFFEIPALLSAPLRKSFKVQSTKKSHPWPGSVLTVEDKDLDASSLSAEFEPGYYRLHKNGQLRERGEKLWAVMSQ